MVYPEDFARVPGKNDKVVVGYKSIEEDDSRDQYFAEPIVLPPAFRNEIRESSCRETNSKSARAIAGFFIPWCMNVSW